MESKADESLEETHDANGSSFSVNDVSFASKSRKNPIRENTETANLISMNSSYVSLSENSDHKPSTRSPDVPGTSDVFMVPKMEDPKASEDPDDSMSGIVTGGETRNDLQTLAMEGSDDFDDEEHDVKVCDICGDAGREDLLAICCKCTDGAEHTYCMREMLEKAPEGDWLCEECKYEQDMETQKQNKTGKANGINKTYPSGQQTAIINSDHPGKAEPKCSDFNGEAGTKEYSYLKSSGKRRMDNAEISSAPKRQALESLSGSPKAQSPNKVSSLSHESSFKNSEKGKVKVHPLSTGAILTNEASASDPRLKTSQGTFSKSNSFNSFVSNPKVKLVDEVFPSKRKLIRETISTTSKEGPIRAMGKSMSFKPTSSNRFSCAESVGKMSSPRFSHDQDMKAKKLTKEQSLFERKNSLRSESMAGSTISSKFDKKSTSHCDIMSNNRDYKAINPDGKPMTISKSSEEVKKPVLHFDGDSPAKGVSNCEEKPNQANPKEDSSSGSCVTERPPCVANQVLLDGSLQPKEYSEEKTRESSGSHSNQNITANEKTSCQKCKGSDHSAQFCKVDKPVIDAPVVKNSREATNSTDDLKAAIEAAMLRKPGICRKSRVPDQSENFSAVNVNSGTSSQDQLTSAHSKRNINCAMKVHERLAISRTSTVCYSNNAKQLGVLPAEGPRRTGDAGTIVVSNENSSILHAQQHFPAAMSILLKAVIPEHQYIWRGDFEVHKSGKTLDLCDGIQAHLSTCASPRVFDAAKKFPCKVLLNEVSRSSTWPMQFREFGVREDNIALFFFAKDLGSYEKSYKALLRNLMKHDLALQGNFGSIELLIFPSNQLPENFQRWNMMFFLWGMFRGKKASRSQRVPGVEKPLTQDILRAVAPSPENVCSAGPMENSVCSTPASDTEIPASKVSKSASSHKVVECIASDSKSEMECTSVQNAEGDSNPNTCDQMSVPSASQADGHNTLHDIASVGSSSKESSNNNDATPSGVSLDYRSNDESAPLVRDNMNEDPTKNVLGSSGVNHNKRSHSASSETDQAIPSSGHANNFVEEVHCNKKWKPTSSGSYGGNDETSTLEGLGNAEKFLFPVDPQPIGSSIQWKVHDPLQDNQFHNKVPNLNLALGDETKPEIPPFLVGKEEKKTMEDYISDSAATKASDEDASASLSLSLLFPFPDKVVQSSSVSKTEPSPLFHFGGLGEKPDQ
nr:uncharacterized protein LOC109194010 [Ipomoea batatas]